MSTHPHWSILLSRLIRNKVSPSRVIDIAQTSALSIFFWNSKTPSLCPSIALPIAGLSGSVVIGASPVFEHVTARVEAQAICSATPVLIKLVHIARMHISEVVKITLVTSGLFLNHLPSSIVKHTLMTSFCNVLFLVLIHLFSINNSVTSVKRTPSLCLINMISILVIGLLAKVPPMEAITIASTI